jgi:hypothetical protein
MLLNEGLEDSWVDRIATFVLAGCLVRERDI